ncbi:hypothetical protein [Pseudomonas fluorescens]|uniref:hypothetical protein n=1 Tax=Pseudomonas fluorescens TaxID=294 RepID=UPI0012FD1CC1|nr:hypothetical protein [Pseudomonas fluorescens]
MRLVSNSRLATRLKQGAQLVQTLMDENDPESSNTPATGYFDHQPKVIYVMAPDYAYRRKILMPVASDTRWSRLALLGEHLALDIYADQSLSVLSALQAYAIKRPRSQMQIRALVKRLRQWPAPATPVVLPTARSFKELYRYRQHVGYGRRTGCHLQTLALLGQGYQIPGNGQAVSFVGADQYAVFQRVQSETRTVESRLQGIPLSGHVSPAPALA